jgi:dGTPase
MTHSLECAQVGTGVLDMLDRERELPPELREWLPNRILIEASCFAHDLGHPPFGHGGEQALFAEMRNCGGFEGNAQTLRQLACLEKYTSAGRGMNPTRRFVLSVLKYPVRYSSFDVATAPKPPKCYYDDEAELVEWAIEGFCESDRTRLVERSSAGKAAHRTFDCSLMEVADDIAYGVHDLEDIIARKLTTKDRWEAALAEAFEKAGGPLETEEGTLTAEHVTQELFADSWRRKAMIGRLVNLFMAACRVIEKPQFTHPLLRFRAGLQGQHEVLLTAMKDMAFHLAIDRAAVQQLERRGKRIVQQLFQTLMEDPRQLVPGWGDTVSEVPTSRRVCDHVAGMTDAYAEKVYRRLFVPGVGSSADEL